MIERLLGELGLVKKIRPSKPGQEIHALQSAIVEFMIMLDRLFCASSWVLGEFYLKYWEPIASLDYATEEIVRKQRYIASVRSPNWQEGELVIIEFIKDHYPPTYPRIKDVQWNANECEITGFTHLFNGNPIRFRCRRGSVVGYTLWGHEKKTAEFLDDLQENYRKAILAGL